MGLAAPKEVCCGGGLLLEGHASGRRRRVRSEAQSLSKRAPYETVFAAERARGHTQHTHMRWYGSDRAAAAPVGARGSRVRAWLGTQPWSCASLDGLGQWASRQAATATATGRQSTLADHWTHSPPTQAPVRYSVYAWHWSVPCCTLTFGETLPRPPAARPWSHRFV